jgi:glutathionyl-hydroquinone reductase
MWGEIERERERDVPHLSCYVTDCIYHETAADTCWFVGFNTVSTLQKGRITRPRIFSTGPNKPRLFKNEYYCVPPPN